MAELVYRESVPRTDSPTQNRVSKGLRAETIWGIVSGGCRDFIIRVHSAGVAELVYARDSKSRSARIEGSSPSSSTVNEN